MDISSLAETLSLQNLMLVGTDVNRNQRLSHLMRVLFIVSRNLAAHSEPYIPHLAARIKVNHRHLSLANDKFISVNIPMKHPARIYLPQHRSAPLEVADPRSLAIDLLHQHLQLQPATRTPRGEPLPPM